MENFESRIGLNVPLEILSRKVCENYNFGKFISNELIEIGYEDFNYILETSKGKYVVKIFNLDRTDEDCINLANRASIPCFHGFSCPKVYSHNDNPLLNIEIDDIKYRLVVMDYINGKDFFSLGEMPTNNELDVIAKELANLNKIDYKPPFIYDKWAIVNFDKEFILNKNVIDNEDKKLVNKAYENYKSIDFKKLNYGFVHGDIIETNVIKDNNGKLYFIDFSVSNYLPRIVDIAVTICDLCIDLNNIKYSKDRIKIFLNSYEKVSPLTEYEKQCLRVFIQVHQANTILQTTIEKKLKNNDSYENEQFLIKGKKGIKLIFQENVI